MPKTARIRRAVTATLAAAALALIVHAATGSAAKAHQTAAGPVIVDCGSCGTGL